MALSKKLSVQMNQKYKTELQRKSNISLISNYMMRKRFRNEHISFKINELQ